MEVVKTENVSRITKLEKWNTIALRDVSLSIEAACSQP